MYLVPSLTFVVGHGVFTTKKFKEGEFLLHYDGDLLSSMKQEKRGDRMTLQLELSSTNLDTEKKDFGMLLI